MKSKLLLTGVLFVGLMSFFSCGKGMEYSCNKEVNGWVEENLKEIGEMTRSGFLELNNETQRAVFRAMSTEQRYDIWINKLNDIFELNWSDQERTHISKLILYLQDNKFIFSDSVEENLRDQFDLFMYKWADFARETFKWDEETLFSIVSNPNEVIIRGNKSEGPFLTSSGGLKVITTVVQDINTEEYCDTYCNDSMNWCANRNDYVRMDCKKGGCRGLNSGCGWFWLQNCNGYCYIL